MVGGDTGRGAHGASWMARGNRTIASHTFKLVLWSVQNGPAVTSTFLDRVHTRCVMVAIDGDGARVMPPVMCSARRRARPAWTPPKRHSTALSIVLYYSSPNAGRTSPHSPLYPRLASKHYKVVSFPMGQ